MKLDKSIIALTASVSIFVLSTPFTSYAQSVDGDTISWPADGWFQVQNVATENWDVCNSSDDGTSCVVPPGTYLLINHTTGEKTDNIVVTASDPGPSDIPNKTESVNVTEDTANVGLATLIRSSGEVEIRLNTTNLDPDSAYTVWVAAFNNPGECIDGCNGPDIPASDGSVFFGTAFVTGSSGVINSSFSVTAGHLPAGTYINAGHNTGIRPENGNNVELHLIISNHGLSSLISDWPEKLAIPGMLPGEQVALFK